MTARILKGSDAAKALGRDILSETAKLKETGVIPTLAIVRVGEKADDIYYQKSAEKRCSVLGITSEIYAFDFGITGDELINEIINLNLDDAVHGILILRPLPEHINDASVCAALDPDKDVDGITDRSLAGVMKNQKQGFAPCTARACVELLKYYNIDTKGKTAVVVGRSLVVGRPVSLMLTALDATVIVCHTKTRNLAEVTRLADILVAAAGSEGLIGKEHIKPGAVVIDVGTNAVEGGGFSGDVNFETASSVASAITPVPGGIGALTSTILALHTVKAAARQTEKE